MSHPIKITDGGRVCTGCGEWKALDAYSRCSKVKSGKKTRCKSCCIGEAKEARHHEAPEQRNGRLLKRRTKAYPRTAKGKNGIAERAGILSDKTSRTKVCSKCLTRKIESDFSKRNGSRVGLKSWCKQCTKDKSKEPEESTKHLKRCRAWTERNPNKSREIKMRHGRSEKGIKTKASCYLKGKYGITLEQRDRLIELQKGRCLICSSKFTKTGPRTPCVDHCHGTSGHVRGVICNLCNLAEGYVKTPEVSLRLYHYMMNNELLSYQGMQNQPTA